MVPVREAGRTAGMCNFLRLQSPVEMLRHDDCTENCAPNEPARLCV